MGQCINCADSMGERVKPAGCFSPIDDGCFDLRIVQGESWSLPLCFMRTYGNIRCLARTGGVTLAASLGALPSGRTKIVCPPPGYPVAGFYSNDVVSADGLTISFKAGTAAEGTLLNPALNIAANICFDSVATNVVGCVAGSSSVTQPIAIVHREPDNWFLDGSIYRSVPASNTRADFGVNYNGSSFWHNFDETSIVVGDSVRIPGAGITTATLVTRVWSQLNGAYDSSKPAGPSNPKMLWNFSLANNVSATGAGCGPAIVEVGRIANFRFALNADRCWEMSLDPCVTATLPYDSSQVSMETCDNAAAMLGYYSVFVNVPHLKNAKLEFMRKRVFEGHVILEPSADGLFG